MSNSTLGIFSDKWLLPVFVFTIKTDPITVTGDFTKIESTISEKHEQMTTSVNTSDFKKYLYSVVYE